MALSFFKAGLTKAHLSRMDSEAEVLSLYYLDFPHRGCRLYFNNESDRIEFYKNHTVFRVYPRNGELVRDYYHASLGLALGYPPLAVDAFMTMTNDCGITYGDMAFTCNFSDIDAVRHWCDSTYGSSFNYSFKVRQIKSTQGRK